MPNEFANQRLRLKDECLFFKIEGEGENAPTKGFLIKISPSPGDRWWTESESALMILDLLVREGGENGIHYNDLKKHLKRRYQLSEEAKRSENNVHQALQNFLTDLKEFGVLQFLGSSATGADIDDNVLYPPSPEPAPYDDPVIHGASTLFCCGYVVTRYRP